MSASDIRAALSHDPLSAAESLTGESYKDDENTMRLGMGLMLMNNQYKESLLRQTSDSYFNMSFADQLSLFADLGFDLVYEEEFAGADGIDHFVVLWHPDGLLATCESYGDHRNSAKVFYNYRHQSGNYPPFELTSSGGMRGDVWVGDHDAREGIRHNLDALRGEGEFLPTWVDRPFFWLLNYSEPKIEDYDHEAITAAKVARLPEHVRRCISPGTSDI